MSGETDPPKVDPDPIDADFEPAAPVADFVSEPETPKQGPGWFALGATGVVAALVGGGVGAMLGGGGSSTTGVTLEQLLEANQANLDSNADVEKRLLELVKGLDDRTRTDINRVRNEVSAAAAGRGDEGAISDLTDQMNSISAQLEAIDVAAQEAGEADGLQLDELLARIEAFERLDEGEVASPRVANRAIKSVQRRVDELEATLATRNEALLDLVSRLEAAEADLGTQGGGDTGEGGAGEEAIASVNENTAAIAALQETVAGLVESASANGTTSEEQERLKRWVQELRAKEALSQSLRHEQNTEQVALVALLAIETAARDGRPFQAAFDSLTDARPNDATVATLAAVAKTGALTIAELRADFDTARKAAEKVATNAGEKRGDGWGWVRQAFGDAVVVRPSAEDGPAEVNETEAILAAAGNYLAGRDLEGAIDAIGGLDAPSRAAFDDWLKAAGDRLTLDKGLENLRADLMDAGR